MSLHAEPIVWTLRWFDRGAYGDPYAAVCTVQMVGEESAYLGGLHGRMSRTMWRAICAWLIGQGVRSLEINRDGRTVRYERSAGGYIRRVIDQSTERAFRGNA